MGCRGFQTMGDVSTLMGLSPSLCVAPSLCFWKVRLDTCFLCCCEYMLRAEHSAWRVVSTQEIIVLVCIFRKTMGKRDGKPLLCTYCIPGSGIHILHVPMHLLSRLAL